MGKSFLCAARFEEFAIKLSSENHPRPRPRPRPTSRNKVFFGKTREARIESSDRVKLEKKEASSRSNPVPGSGSKRVPLAQVVGDCVKRWFEDTLREAKSGDVGMQVLVGQMYRSGYGVPKDEHKGLAWINRASGKRLSAWQVSDKRPGYNASDSDSNDAKD